MSALSPSPDGPAAPRRFRLGPLERISRLPMLAPPDGQIPPLHQRKRRNRTWMALMMLTPLCLAAISLLAFDTDGSGEPTVEPVSTPAGYYGVTDAYFGYAVPDAYQQNVTWTDQNADFLYGDARAFVAETLLVTKTAPTAASRAPASLAAFGEAAPVPYTLHPGHALAIPGTAFGYEETLTRPGGYRAVVIDTWERSTSTQMWLLIRAPAAVTQAVITSLRG